MLERCNHFWKGNDELAVTLSISSASGDYQYTMAEARRQFDASGQAVGALEPPKSVVVAGGVYEGGKQVYDAVSALDWTPVIDKLETVCKVLDAISKVCC